MFQLNKGFGYITTSKAPSSFDSSDSSSSGSSLEPSKSFMSGSMESSDWQYIWPQITKSVGGTMGWLTISLALQVVFAVLYNRVVVDDILDQGKLDERMNHGDGGGRAAHFTRLFNEALVAEIAPTVPPPKGSP